MRILLLLLLPLAILWGEAKITPNEVYSQVMLIRYEVFALLDYYGIEYDKEEIKRRSFIEANLKPRNVWQKTYEIAVKINILRKAHGLPVIEPVNMAPVLHLNPDLVYEQTQRLLTELKIFETRMDISIEHPQPIRYYGKRPLDVFRALTQVSIGLDLLNGERFTPAYVFGQQMRVNDDITRILKALKIPDSTIPDKKNPSDTPAVVFKKNLQVLEKIKQLQIGVGIEFVDFSGFERGDEEITPSEVYTITQMVIAELQTIKAYIGIEKITPPAEEYDDKTPAEVSQLVGWNLRKLRLIRTLNKEH